MWRDEDVARRNLSTKMRQPGHEFSVGAPSRSLDSGGPFDLELTGSLAPGCAHDFGPPTSSVTR